MMNLRQQTILQQVNDRKRVSVSELSQATLVSEVTIRHDLNLLEKRGLLKRVHGSAVALESDDIDVRMMRHFFYEAKNWPIMPPRWSMMARQYLLKAAAATPYWLIS